MKEEKEEQEEKNGNGMKNNIDHSPRGGVTPIINDNNNGNGVNQLLAPMEEVEPAQSIDMANDQSISELLPKILVDCYKKLMSQCNNNKLSISKYVILSDLEREVKNAFRDTTPYDFDIVEFDYVCFKQLLMMEYKKNADFKVKVVNCEKQLMCYKRGEKYEPKQDKIMKHGREYDACTEIETYVVITDNNNDDNKDNDDDNEILENISYLNDCNVISKMKAIDVYSHIKLIHSNCSFMDIENEPYNNININDNSFDEIASELRENNITGSRILEMKWSNWEMLHELNRYDPDHQDFVEDIVSDFFFPFGTGEALSNAIASSTKLQQNISIFDSEQMRSKFTLCIDYGLFSSRYPILHYFIKTCELSDCERLLKIHKNLSVDVVVGQYSSMHIAAWRGKFKLLELLTRYGGDPLKVNKQNETAFEAGKKYPAKLKWFFAKFPQYDPQ